MVSRVAKYTVSHHSRISLYNALAHLCFSLQIHLRKLRPALHACGQRNSQTLDPTCPRSQGRNEIPNEQPLTPMSILFHSCSRLSHCRPVRLYTHAHMYARSHTHTHIGHFSNYTSTMAPEPCSFCLDTQTCTHSFSLSLALSLSYIHSTHTNTLSRTHIHT